MKKSGFDQYYDEAVEPGKRERAYAWATAIGLQDVDGLKPSKRLLATAKRHIEGEINQEEARRIVDEYYETKDGHDLPKDTKEVADLHTHCIIEPVKGHGKGAYRFTSSSLFCRGALHLGGGL